MSVCSAEPLTHTRFPAVCVCVPAVTHCVSQHPSDICRPPDLPPLARSGPAPLSHWPNDITGAAAQGGQPQRKRDSDDITG